MLGLLRQLKYKKLKSLLLMGHGAIVGVSAQGDLHYALGLAKTTGLILCGFLIIEDRWGSVFKAGLLVALGCMVTLVPMAIQSLYTPEHVLSRWGMFVHARFETSLYFHRSIILAAACIVLLPSVRGLMPIAVRPVLVKERIRVRTTCDVGRCFACTFSDDSWFWKNDSGMAFFSAAI